MAFGTLTPASLFGALSLPFLLATICLPEQPNDNPFAGRAFLSPFTPAAS
jgi:hypothetical protein